MASFTLLFSALILFSVLTLGHSRAVDNVESHPNSLPDDGGDGYANSSDLAEETGGVSVEEADLKSNEGVMDENSKAEQEESNESAQEESTESAQEESTEPAQEESTEAAQSSESAQEQSNEAAQEESTEAAQSTESAQEQSNEAAQEESTEAAQSTESAQEQSDEAAQEESTEAAQSTESAQEQSNETAQEESTEAAQEESSDKAQEVSDESDEDGSDSSEDPAEDTGGVTVEEADMQSNEGIINENSKAVEEDSNGSTQEESNEPDADQTSEAAQQESNEPAQEESSEAAQQESNEPAQEESNEAAQEETNPRQSGEPSSEDSSGVVDNQNELQDPVDESGDEGAASDTPQRRKRSSGREFLLSQDHHPMEVTLVHLDSDHHRVKRTSFNVSSQTWPHRIPYVFDDNYNKNNVHQLEEVLKFLQNHVCIEFKHEPSYDPSNPNWFKDHGYSTNAYIRFKTKSACVALYGRGANDKGARTISPCNQLFSMMHEVIHSLGGIHSQNYPQRESYITVHRSNINPRMVHNYKKSKADSSEVEYEYFDPSSLLMYGQSYFTQNGQRTYDFIRPDMAHLSGPASYDNILWEISINYNCKDEFCAHEDQDCGEGYMGYVNQKCTCVCPSGFDPSTKCKQLINQVGGSESWPDTSYTLFRAKQCPDGMETGQVPIPGRRPPKTTLKTIPSAGKTLNVGMCTKKTDNQDFEAWPMGAYCIGKVEGVPCATPFKEGSISLGTVGSSSLSGSVGDITASGNKLTMKFCCRQEGDTGFPMKLPTDKPFRLLSKGITCQAVDGMWALPAKVVLSNKGMKSGSAPNVKINRRGVALTSCYYQPPKYDCNQEAMLDSSNPSVTVSVPTTGGARESNRRCFYYFKVPEKSRLRLTINSMKLHPQDRFLVRSFNPLENPFRIRVRDPRHQMITEKNVLIIEYWSFYQYHRGFKGAKFTVDILPAADLCYDVDSNGADYAGDKSVSETYEECVPWAEATSCPDFPWSDTHGLSLLNSGSSCRNLDTNGMLQPWCYNYVNDTVCNKRYCDVCNEASPLDHVAKCQEYMSKDPDFCTSSLGRLGCFKSCGLDTSPYDKSQVKCGKPEVPSGLTAQGDLQDSYDIGASVTVSCNGQDTSIECNSHGWTPFDDQCAGQQCIDASQLCQNALAKFPEFCSNSGSKATADKYCKKSCGLCNDGSAVSCSVSGGTNYSPSSGSSVTAGQEASFECNTGLHHVSGSLQQACGLSGKLLGEQPACADKQAPADINIKQVAAQQVTMPKITAFLMLGDGLDIPFDGKITKWYYYCKNDKSITLLVYRRTGNAKAFKLIGSNQATCVLGWPWAQNVPANQQIAVQKGDVLGVYNQRPSVLMQPCRGAKEVMVPVATTRARRLPGLLRRKVMTFKGKACAYLALGARVEPN